MGNNGEKIYGEFGSGRVKNSPFFTIFPHDFFWEIWSIQVGLSKKFDLDPLISSFFNSIKQKIIYERHWTTSKSLI